jgi:hypothetical protein
VTYVDHRQIRRGAKVQAESLYEAAVLAIKPFREDPWLEKGGRATMLDIEVRAPGIKHAISLQHVERWTVGATTNPNGAAKLMMRSVRLWLLQRNAAPRATQDGASVTQIRHSPPRRL